MLSTPLICCSIGVATDCSTTSAVGAGVGALDADGRRRERRVLLDREALSSAATPPSTIRIEMTMATMGRRMKKLRHGYFTAGLDRRWGRGRRARCRRSVAFTVTPSRTFCRPSTTTRSPGCEAALDHPQRPDAVAGRHRPHRRSCRPRHDRDAEGGLQLRDRALRHEDRVLLHLDGGAHPRVLARTDEPLGIRERGLEQQRAGRRVDEAVGEDDAPEVRDASSRRRGSARGAAARLCAPAFAARCRTSR